MTVIPPFFVYEETWRRSGTQSPFQVNWLNFKEDCDLGYLEVIIKVMDEQIEMWGMNYISSFHEVFVYFNGYIESLKHFYCFVIGVTFESLWSEVGPTALELETYAQGLPKDWGLDTNELLI